MMTEIVKTFTVSKAMPVFIDSVSLLTEEEFEANKDIISDINHWWWLRTPSNNVWCPRFIKAVDPNKSANVIFTGNILGVRPALHINDPESSHLREGDEFWLGNYKWTMLRNGLALCKCVVHTMRFREDWKAEDGDDYEKSDVKSWLENWAKEKGIVDERDLI